MANEETAVYYFPVDGEQKRERAEQACKAQLEITATPEIFRDSTNFN